MAKRFHEEVMGVYFDDLDPFHILHNARYLLLFERTLGAFWMEVFRGGFNESDDRFHFVRTNQIEYLRPVAGVGRVRVRVWVCLLYTSPSPRDQRGSRMPSSA